MGLEGFIFWMALAVAAVLAAGCLYALMRVARVIDPSRGRRRCPRCWYGMEGVKELRCPECGLEMRSERELYRTRFRGVRLASVVVLVVAIGCFGAWKCRRDGFLWIVPTRVLLMWEPSEKPLVKGRFLTRPGPWGGVLRFSSAQELLRRNAFFQLTDADWETFVWAGGLMQVPKRWVRSEPLALTMERPFWIRGSYEIEVEIAKPHAEGSEREFYRPTLRLLSGTTRVNKIIGPSPDDVRSVDPGMAGERSIVFTREHAARFTIRTGPGVRPATGGGFTQPLLGEPIRFVVPIEPVLYDTLDEALPPWSGADVDALMREHLRASLAGTEHGLTSGSAQLLLYPDRDALRAAGVENTELRVELWYGDTLVKELSRVSLILDGSDDDSFGRGTRVSRYRSNDPAMPNYTDASKWRLRILADRLETLRLHSPSRCWSGQLWYTTDELANKPGPFQIVRQQKPKAPVPTQVDRKRRVTPPTPPAP